MLSYLSLASLKENHSLLRTKDTYFASKGGRGGLLFTYVLWLEIHQLLFNWSQSTSFPGSLILPWEWGCKSMVTYSFKPRPNDRNMSTQHIATLLGPTCCVFGHRVVMCCNMLGVVGSNLTSFRLEPTTANMSQHGGQTHATCCAQQCCDMLRWHVAIVWPGF